MYLRSICRTAALAAAIVATAASAQTTPRGYSQFYVFGDSLVDAGNIDFLTGIPDESQGYFDGRFTNGYNYPDLLSLRLFGRPTIASLEGGTNYAYGGARIVTNASDAIPDLQAQLGQYNAAARGIADPNALYILNAGGNDIFGLGSGNILPFTTPEAYVNSLISTYTGGVTFLNSIGARNILITGIPNATDPRSPAIEARFLAALNSLTLAADTRVLSYSYLSFFGRVASNPGSLGLPPLRTDTTCLRERTPSPTIDCTGIFSFDGIHPTAAVQAALARDIDRQFAITAVPEPQTWLMMITGFGITGAALRRRNRVAMA